MSEDRVALYKAFAKARQEMAPLIRSKRGGQGKYVPLDQVIDIIDTAFNANGLTVAQPLQAFADGTAYVETIVMHVDTGQILTSQFPITPGEPNRSMNSHQALGSAITYARRYALQAIVCVAPEDDDDAQATSSAPAQQPRQAPPAQPKTAEGPGAPTPEAWDKKIRDTPEVGFQQLGITAANAFKESHDNSWMMHGLIQMAPSARVLNYLHGLCQKVDMTGEWPAYIGKRSQELEAQGGEEGGSFS